MGYSIISTNPTGDPNAENAEEINDLAHFTCSWWSSILAFAHFYGGWKPAGTLEPDWWKQSETINEEWNGTYFSNDGQIVLKDDAAALATALESALSDLLEEEKLITGINSNMQELVIPNDPYTEAVTKFMKLCRKGGFIIV